MQSRAAELHAVACHVLLVMLLADLNQRQRAPQSPVHRINSSHRTTQRARIDRVFNLVRVSPIVQELFNVLRVYVCVVYLCKIFDFFKVFISFPKCISSLAHWAMSACMIDFEDLCPDIQTQQTESCLCYFLHSRPNQIIALTSVSPRFAASTRLV